MPQLPLFISGRYLFAKKSHNAINIITGISVAVLALGTTALVLILSVFNGLENLISNLYNTVKPDIEIRPVSGKFFSLDSLNYQPNNDPEIACWSEVIEDMALAKYSNDEENERQTVVKFKAVKPTYNCISGIDTMVYDGNFIVEHDNIFFTVTGYGVAERLGLRLNNPSQAINLYYPNAQANQNDLLNAFNIETVIPSGIISLQQEDDERMIYISLKLATRLMNLKPNLATSIELQLKEGVNDETFASNLQAKLGEKYTVKDRRQMNSTLYKITQSEKWSGFMILSFIILLAAFNVVGSITVLILEKREDIKTYQYLGFTNSLIRKIFLYEGMLISLAGGIGGMLLGLILVLLQQRFGFVPMEGGFVVTSFPVALRFTDFIFVFLLILFIGFISTWIPINRMKIFENK